MKSTISAIALAASLLPLVLASPLRFEEREADVEWQIVTDVEVVTAYATEYATEGAPAPTVSYTAQATTETMSPSTTYTKGRHNHWSYQTSTVAATSTSEPAPVPTTSSTSTTEAAYTPPVVAPTTTSTTVAPPPPATTSTTQAPPAPTTTAAAAPTTTAAAPPSYTGPAVVSGDASYDSANLQAAVMNSTNVWRAMFQAPAAVWNQSLADMAAVTAQACNWDHTNAGQNYAGSYSGPESAIDGWGGEYTQYDFSNPGYTDVAGHFTQLVWQDSTSTGCAAYHCPQTTSATGWFFVCNYYPIGNWVMAGEFAANVKSKVS